MTIITGNGARQRSHHWWPSICLLSLSIFYFIFCLIQNLPVFNCLCFQICLGLRIGDFQVCQCIAQTSLAHWAQPNILYLWFTPFTCTAHIPSLYKSLYCTLLYTHQYIDYLVFLCHFIFLIWYQSHSSDFLVPVDISSVLPLPSPSSSSH